MADCDARCDNQYNSLLQQLYVSLGIGGGSLLLFEILRKLKRPNLPIFPGSDTFRREKYIFGYLYLARCFTLAPSQPHPKWPLQWIWQVLKLKNSQLVDKIGGDTTVYLHWLKSCLFFTLSLTIVVVPVLLPIHYHFSSGAERSNMNIASLTQLVSNEEGSKLLYIHMLLHVFITATWLITLLYFINGSLKIREYLAKSSSNLFRGINLLNDSDSAWKSKSIVVTNIPNSLRDENVLASYFTFYLDKLNRKKASSSSRRNSIMSLSSLKDQFMNESDEPQLNTLENLEDLMEETIEDVSIVRKYDKLLQLRKKRDESIQRLELAYISLANTLLGHTKNLLKVKSRDDEQLNEYDEILFKSISPFLFEFEKPSFKLKESIEIFFKNLFGKTDNFVKFKDSANSTNLTIWEVILSLPKPVIEKFQPTMRVKPLFQSLFSKSKVKQIDYLTAKVKMLSSSIEGYQTQSPLKFSPTSTAFVTFKNVSDSKLACKKLSHHPTKPHACLVRPAPFFSDIDWEVAITSKSATHTIRGFLVRIAIWGFILFYVLPMAALSSLFSIERLRHINKKLGAYFDKHEHQSEIFTSLLPTLIVAFIALLMPAILFGIGKKAQPHLTWSKLHNQIFHRYWVFMITNILITFCIGASTFQSILERITSESGLSLLQIIAHNFPQAAPFFASWTIIQVSIQNFVQLPLIGLPLLTYFFVTLKSKTPRQRMKATNPRTPDFHVFGSNTLLAVSVSLVMGLFNPLVIPFTLIYFMASNIVFRNQFYHVYSRRLYDTGGKWVTIRLFRYGVDALCIAQVAFFAFHVVRYKSGAQNYSNIYAILTGIIFFITILVKLLITRQIKARFEGLELLDGLWRSDKTLNDVYLVDSQTIEWKYSNFIEKKHLNELLSQFHSINLEHLNDDNKINEKLSFRIKNFFLLTHFSPMQLIKGSFNELFRKISRLRRKFIPIMIEKQKIPEQIYAQKSKSNLNLAEIESGNNGNASSSNLNNDNNSSFLNYKPSESMTSLIKKVNLQSQEMLKPVKNIGKSFSSSNDRITKVGVHLNNNSDEIVVKNHKLLPPINDYPDESKRYDCPFYYDLLDHYLLLPRDPTSAIDLDDLIELHYGSSSDENSNNVIHLSQSQFLSPVMETTPSTSLASSPVSTTFSDDSFEQQQYVTETIRLNNFNIDDQGRSTSLSNR